MMGVIDIVNVVSVIKVEHFSLLYDLLVEDRILYFTVLEL
jgi:hypothetical protein